jgi:protein arginine N-methyltransferase 2
MAPEPESLDDRISERCPAEVKEVLQLAWDHDVANLRRLVNEPGRASGADPQTGETPLHAAIRSRGSRSAAADDSDLSKAKDTAHELFLAGAIWNDLDSNDETPGCVAWRLGQTELYDLCVDAGVRAELLFGLLDGYEKLSSILGPEDDDDENGLAGPGADGDAPELVAVEPNGHPAQGHGQVHDSAQSEEATATEPQEGGHDGQGRPNGQVPYLASTLVYDGRKLVDEAQNAVMMAWETDIMRQSVDALLPGAPAGKRILNIGFGMGIIDTMFADTNPSLHHIIEAHPDVLERLRLADSKFGPSWEASGPFPHGYHVYPGRWQDVCPRLLEDGQVYDAIYFDTFGEDYSQLRHFFTEYLLGLLDENGRFSFFNGLGADRRVCYDVYTKVAEMHLMEAGLDVDWTVIDVDLAGLDKDGEGEWTGVARRYWTLDSKCPGSVTACPDLPELTQCHQSIAFRPARFWDEPSPARPQQHDGATFCSRRLPTVHCLEMLRVQDAVKVPLVDSLQCESRDQCSADAAPVLCRKDLNRILIFRVCLLGPVENLAKRLGAACFEVRILVEDGAVSAHVARFVALLLANSRNATGRQTCSPRADKLCRPPYQLKFCSTRCNVQLVLEEVERL